MHVNYPLVWQHLVCLNVQTPLADTQHLCCDSSSWFAKENNFLSSLCLWLYCKVAVWMQYLSIGRSVGLRGGRSLWVGHTLVWQVMTEISNSVNIKSTIWYRYRAFVLQSAFFHMCKQQKDTLIYMLVPAQLIECMQWNITCSIMWAFKTVL